MDNDAPIRDSFLANLKPPSGAANSRELFDDTLSGIPCRDFNGRTCPVLGQIVLLEKLGEGGMGSVYRGVDLSTEQELAIKLLPQYLARRDPNLVSRLQREATVAAKVDSPHLVRVYGADDVNGQFYLSMELVRGISAGAFLKNVRAGQRIGLREIDAYTICIAAGTGLAAAHEAGIVHRDIKPDNILIPMDDGTPLFAHAKLADLGLARSESMGNSLTGSQITMGTPGYMAPEQARNSTKAGRRADVFSMGATLYTLLAGRPPYYGQTPLEAILAVLQGDHPALDALRPDVSSQTVELVERCLARDPRERFKDAAEFVEALVLVLNAGLLCEAEAPPRTSQSDAEFPAGSTSDLGGLQEESSAALSDVGKLRGLIDAGLIDDAAKLLATLKRRADRERPAAGAVTECERLLCKARVEALVLEANQKMNSGDLAGAEQIVMQALAVDPDSIEARGAMESIRALQRDIQCRLALDEARIFLVDEKFDGDFWFVSKERRSGLQSALERARRHRPDHPDLLYIENRIGPPNEIRLDLGNAASIEAVIVPKGEFRMGPPESVKTVRVEKSFYLAKFPVTVAQFRRFAEVAKYTTYAERQTSVGKAPPSWRNPGFPQKDNEPAVMITWYDARAFCTWLTGLCGRQVRLPTEIEWEYAARGPKGFIFPWGDRWNSTYANHADQCLRAALKSAEPKLKVSDGKDGYAYTSPVGALSNASWAGVYDLAGNVWEWCEESYSEQPGVVLAAPVSKYRVCRGGSWRDLPDDCRAFARLGCLPDYRAVTHGFRIAVAL
ncbi:MAG TPA: SUMF1/EgtB/PvdO family nonheme iron enzyme [Planctomycetota bacterium]|nr:SUMF1/EgtB/PvdO family nonheme iron enzyme [Planctomycetota bacterium]